MEVLGVIEPRVYVADSTTDTLFAFTEPDTVEALVVDPDHFAKFSGAYLVEPDGDRADTALKAVTRYANDEPPELPVRGEPPDPAAPAFIVGELKGVDRAENVLSASADQAAADTLVWIESDPATVTTMADLDEYRTVTWEEAPRPSGTA